MTENRPNITDSIEIRKWSSLQSAVGIGKKPCLVKHFFNVTDFSYNILLYDGIQLWSEEIVGKERFQEKCKVRLISCYKFFFYIVFVVVVVVMEYFLLVDCSFL